MLINAISYLAIIVALLADEAAARERRGPRQSMLEAITRGPRVTYAAIRCCAGSCCSRPRPRCSRGHTSSCLPAEAQFLGVGAVELSWLLAASGAGALVGALATASLGGLKRRGAVLVGERARARSAALDLRRAAHADRRDGLHRTHELRGDGVPGDGERADADAHARSSARSRDERAHDGDHGLHAARADAARARSVRSSASTRAFLVGGIIVVLVSTFVLLRAPALREAIATAQSTSGGALGLKNPAVWACFRPLDRSLDAPYVLEHTF